MTASGADNTLDGGTSSTNRCLPKGDGALANDVDSVTCQNGTSRSRLLMVSSRISLTHMPAISCRQSHRARGSRSGCCCRHRAKNPWLSGAEPCKPAQTSRETHPTRARLQPWWVGLPRAATVALCWRTLRLVLTARVTGELPHWARQILFGGALRALCNAAQESRRKESANVDLVQQQAPSHPHCLHALRATSLRVSGSLHAASLLSARWTSGGPQSRRDLYAFLCTHGVPARPLIGRLRQLSNDCVNNISVGSMHSLVALL